MIKVVIFDADGVLIHGERFSQALMRDYGISTKETLPFFEGSFQECLVGEADLKDVIEPYLATWELDMSVEALLDYWFSVEHSIDFELVAYIQELRKNGIICILATNNEKHRFAYMLKQMGFADCFDKTYSSAHLGHKKPNTEFFAKIFGELRGIEKKEILFVDDSEENIEGAKTFGIYAEKYTTLEDFKNILHAKNN